MGLFHHPPGKDRDQQSAQRQHDRRGQEFHVVEEGTDQEGLVLPDIERQHRPQPQHPGAQTHNHRRHGTVNTLFDQPGHHRLRQTDRGAPSGTHHQYEKQRTEQQTARHLTKRQRQGHKHHARSLPRLQPTGEQQREHGHTATQCDQRVQQGNNDHRGHDGHRLLLASLTRHLPRHIGPIGHDRAHTQAQGKKGLADSGNHCLTIELGKVEGKQELDTLHETRRRGGVAHQHQQQHKQQRHQDLHGFFQPPFYATANHHHGQQHEQGVIPHHQPGTGQHVIKTGTGLRRRNPLEGTLHRFPRIVERPAGHHGIERQDQERRQHPHIPDPGPTLGDLALRRQLAHGVNRAHPALAAQHHFRRHDRHTHHRDTQQVQQDKCPAPVFAGDVRETPDVPQPDRRTGRRQNKNPTAGPHAVNRLALLLHNICTLVNVALFSYFLPCGLNPK